MVDPTAHWEPSDSGEIAQADTRVMLGIVVPNDYTTMVKQGKNMFKSEDGFTPLEMNKRMLKPGHLEGSAVDPAAEMVELITASRMIETNLKMVQQQDDMSNGLINRLLRVS